MGSCCPCPSPVSSRRAWRCASLRTPSKNCCRKACSCRRIARLSSITRLRQLTLHECHDTAKSASYIIRHGALQNHPARCQDPLAVHHPGCKGKLRSLYPQIEVCLDAGCSMRKQRDQDDERDRNTEEPQQYRTHRCSPNYEWVEWWKRHRSFQRDASSHRGKPRHPVGARRRLRRSWRRRRRIAAQRTSRARSRRQW